MDLLIEEFQKVSIIEPLYIRQTTDISICGFSTENEYRNLEKYDFAVDPLTGTAIAPQNTTGAKTAELAYMMKS